MKKLLVAEPEDRASWVFRMPDDVYRDLAGLRKDGWELRPLFRKLAEERLQPLAEALTKLGFAPVPADSMGKPKRKPMKIRMSAAVLNQLKRVGGKVGLDPATLLFLLIRAEARGFSIPGKRNP